MTEADVHFELYRHLQNAVDADPTRGAITYDDVVAEYGTGIRGFADLVVFDSAEEPVFVVEAKRATDDTARSNLDPYAPEVIRQAFEYAAELGASYFATYNGERLVLFRTFEEGEPLLQRSSKSYEISGIESFADTLLDEVARIEAGDQQWDNLDDAFVDRIRSLHELIAPRLTEALAERLDDDRSFHDRFVSWASTQGYEYDDTGTHDRAAIRQMFAEQAAYLLTNKIIFYRLLESTETYGEILRPLSVSPYRVKEDLVEHFEQVVERVDFEAVFHHDPIYDEIPLDDVGARIRDFVIELGQQDLAQFDSDVIGRIYEGVIPAERRHALGEYYTPPALCDLLTRLTVEQPDDRVLDPACGSGGFLVSAYHRKLDLLAEEEGSHDRLLSSLYGIDINRFPAHLTAINLAIQNLDVYTETVNVEVGDFFETGPESLDFGRTQASASGSESASSVIDPADSMDAIVGNPPYIRQENIEDKDAVRAHLSAVDGTGLSKRSDIYAYFLTHATQFLDTDGRLGFVTSDRWLDTRYGADLQAFVLDNYRVEAIVKFGRQAFDDALVGSCALVLSKDDDERRRRENVTKFLRVEDELDIEELVSVVEEETAPNRLVRTESYRLVTRRQAAIREETKWSVFFNAPPIYFDAVGHPDIVPLDDIASVGYGEKSGANEFFFRRSEEWNEWGLAEYTEPLLKATGQVDRISFDDSVADEWGYLAVHDLVEAALDEGPEYGDTATEKQVVDWLEANDHEELLNYVEWGEQQGFHERKSTRSRDVWFDLGHIDVPPILMTDFTWREHRVIWNEAGAVGSNQFYAIEPISGVDPKVLCGILNSRLTWLMCELKGRWAEGAGMARSRLMVYETESLPVPDPRSYTAEQRRRIRQAFDELVQREADLGEEASVEATTSERDELDRAVLDPLGLGESQGEITRGVERLVELREQAAGQETEVMVSRPTESEVVELAGVEQSSDGTTLSDF